MRHCLTLRSTTKFCCWLISRRNICHKKPELVVIIRSAYIFIFYSALHSIQHSMMRYEKIKCLCSQCIYCHAVFQIGTRSIIMNTDRSISVHDRLRALSTCTSSSNIFSLDIYIRNILTVLFFSTELQTPMTNITAQFSEDNIVTPLSVDVVATVADRLLMIHIFHELITF